MDSDSGELPYSAACERNQTPIVDILREVFATSRVVLEVGSGTGQHAVHFAQAMPHLVWQPSDRPQSLSLSQARIAKARLANLRATVELDVDVSTWPIASSDSIFTANTLHIIREASVQAFFRGVGRVLDSPGTLAVYGPFRYRGQFTSASNAEFDAELRARNQESGIRDFETVNTLAMAIGLRLVGDYSLPANNQLLVWSR